MFSMSKTHYLPNGLLVPCDECKKFLVSATIEPCKTCLENCQRSLDQEETLECFFESMNPEEDEKLAAFINEHKELIGELYEDSVVLKIPISQLASLWQYRDVLRKYCGDKPPVDIFKKASEFGVSMRKLEFQLRRNIRLRKREANN